MNANYKTLAEYDRELADVYMDRYEYQLTHKEIANYRNLTVEQVRFLLTEAKRVLNNPENYLEWSGLCHSARRRVLAAGYRTKQQLFDDVMAEKIDLENLPGIGHGTAVVIRRWLIKKKGQ